MTSGKLFQICSAFVSFLFMFTYTSYSDNGMPSATPAMSPLIGSPDIGDPNDESGALDEALNIAVKKIDLVIDKSGCELPDDENDDSGNYDPNISDVIGLSGMGRSSLYLDVKTEWMTFPALALYDDDEGGESDVILGQGTWFDRRALKDGGIVD